MERSRVGNLGPAVKRRKSARVERATMPSPSLPRSLTSSTEECCDGPDTGRSIEINCPLGDPALAAEARRLKARGIEVLDFALGEPDFDTPLSIQQAAVRAMGSGQTHYTPAAGIPELPSGCRGVLHEGPWAARRSGPGRHLQRVQAVDPQRVDDRLRAG